MYSKGNSGGYYDSRRASSIERRRYERSGNDNRSHHHHRRHSSSGRHSPSRRNRRSPSPRNRDSSRYRRSPSPGPSHRRHESRGDSPSRHGEERGFPDWDRKHAKERRRATTEENRNVLERMEHSFSDGPLNVLKECMNNKTRVKVWTRNAKGIKGICSGFILAFDKHWNIIIKDMDEVYLQPRKGRNPFLSEIQPDNSIPEINPKIHKVKKVTNKEETSCIVADAKITDDAQMLTNPVKFTQEDKAMLEKRERNRLKRMKQKMPLLAKRHVPQIFIRGDNVVLISLCPRVSTKEEDESGLLKLMQPKGVLEEHS